MIHEISRIDDPNLTRIQELEAENARLRERITVYEWETLPAGIDAHLDDDPQLDFDVADAV